MTNRDRKLLQNLELNPSTGNIDEVLTRRWRRGGVDDDEVQISLSWLLKLPEISKNKAKLTNQPNFAKLDTDLIVIILLY